MSAIDRLIDDDLDRLREAVETIEDDKHETDRVHPDSWAILLREARRLLSTATHREAMAPAPVRADPWEDAWEPVVGEFVSINLPACSYVFPGVTSLGGTVVEVFKGIQWPYHVRVTYGTAPVTQTLPFGRDEIAPFVLDRS